MGLASACIGFVEIVRRNGECTLIFNESRLALFERILEWKYHERIGSDGIVAWCDARMFPVQSSAPPRGKKHAGKEAKFLPSSPIAQSVKFCDRAAHLCARVPL
jgi:hypothetical protein